MIRRFISLLALFLLVNHATASTQLLSDSSAVRNFINEMVEQHAFNSNELQTVFDQANLHQSILDAISRPAESKPWYEYRPIFVTTDRSKGGVRFWQAHAGTLEKASDVYGVPQEIMVAIIGVETRYGRHTGRYPVLDALSTLAFAYPPRSSFFRKELKEYLLMTREEGLQPGKQMGSYAGAMGMPQFIPSSFRHYAVDFDNDGKRDLWTSPADAIGSVGNYFKQHRWKSGQPIASPVKVHGSRYQALIDLINGFAGAELTADDVTALGQSVLKNERDFNARAGLTSKDDRLPGYMLKEQLAPHNIVFEVTDEELDQVHNY